MSDRRTLVLLSQVYLPDPAAVGQYLHELAVALVERGMRVIVIAADRGYDDPSCRFARYEEIAGVQVLRVPWSSFGKGSLRSRLAGGGIFTSEAALLAASLPRVDHVLVSTSPPMCALAGIAVSLLRRAPLTFWAMDINPDQIVGTGRMTAEALPVRAFEWMNRRTLAHAHSVITLDEFMAERLRAKSAAVRDKLQVSPLWSLVPSDADAAAGESFRRAHGFGAHRVVMYSGNLSPVHPVDTLLSAAAELRTDERLQFVFIGGGLGREAIAQRARAERLDNVRFLPYQSLATLPQSLAAADLHLVSMGAQMVGIVHPSKIYSAMAVGRPILALGPARSHVARLVREHDLGWHVEHDDVAGTVAALREFSASEPEALHRLGQRARATVDAYYSRSELLPRLCAHIERAR